MTWTLRPDDPVREKFRRVHARRSPRASTGKVVYPIEFWRHARAHPNAGLTSGAFPVQTPQERTAAGDPAVPLSVYRHRVIYPVDSVERYEREQTVEAACVTFNRRAEK